MADQRFRVADCSYPSRKSCRKNRMADQRFRVADCSELKDGQMKQVYAGKLPLLLIHIHGQWVALGAHCPHYGAPLVEGTLCEGKLLCPWHQATFDVVSGDLVEPPALDALPQFQVQVEGGDVYVLVPDQPSDRRTMPMSRTAAADSQTYVAIIGAGAAGSAAAETLRQLGFAGRVHMISADRRAPYDRPNCSKDYLAGEADPAWMPLRPPSFYNDYDIEMDHRRVTSFDAASRTIIFDDGTTIEPDVVLVATGGIPRTLDVPGSTLHGVHTLRTWDDSDAIIASAANARRAVVVGASFIGMEAAASLRHRGLEVTVVAPSAVPFEHALGEPVGRLIQRLHEDQGVQFELGRTVQRIAGNHGVEGVVLDNATRIDAELVLVGIGVRPATDFVQGLSLNSDGSIDVDEQLRAAEGVWAAGDIARYPEAYVGQRVRIEHWRLAQQHGRAAARSIAGQGQPFVGVPFFWTRQFSTSIGFVGPSVGFDEVIMTGSPEQMDFTAFYIKNDRLVAAAGTQSLRLHAFALLMQQGKLPSPTQIREGPAQPIEEALHRQAG